MKVLKQYTTEQWEALTQAERSEHHDQLLQPVKRKWPLWTAVMVPGKRDRQEVVGYAVQFDGVLQVLVQPEGQGFDPSDQHLGVPWGDVRAAEDFGDEDD